MELEITRVKRKLQTATGFVSFLGGIMALAGLNASMLIETDVFPDTMLVKLPLLGLFLGVFGLVTRNRSRMYAWWGIGLNLFILVFTFMMFGLSWTINAKP
ncbi:hypothetical protein [Mesobacillus foraminis]|uniref:Uncharacterized protein n=1 Tax=Mesobacillus foraminis TaxID=279826 RepID=A0A4R2BH01_9BACI|nr:hypothetical protein [Mesobacillus foraminis]TCN26146.1 hypothetical protein EV146_104254 [Mesobacillus foraminis]